MTYSETEKQAHIRELQQYLLSLSKVNKKLLAVPVSGIFDSQTADAVRTFQREWNFPETGVVDEIVWNAIVEEYRRLKHSFSPPESISPFRIPYYVVKPGEKNDLVYIIQLLMNSLADKYSNLPKVNLNGEFDMPTQTAVRRLQEVGGLSQTGNVDRETWDLLAKAFNNL